MTNVAIIKQKIDEGCTESLINYEEEISSNFYEALNGLDLQAENTTVEFIAEWSPTVKSNRCQYNKVSVTNDYYEPIRNIISKIKESTNERTTIVGKIKQLKAAPVIDKRQFGMVVVVYVGDNERAKSVTVKLDKEDYENAVIAHQHGKAVKLVGDLKEHPKAVMENVIFNVIE